MASRVYVGDCDGYSRVGTTAPGRPLSCCPARSAQPNVAGPIPRSSVDACTPVATDGRGDRPYTCLTVPVLCSFVNFQSSVKMNSMHPARAPRRATTQDIPLRLPRFLVSTSCICCCLCCSVCSSSSCFLRPAMSTMSKISIRSTPRMARMRLSSAHAPSGVPGPG